MSRQRQVDPEEDVAFDYELSIRESAPPVTSCFVGDVLADTVRASSRTTSSPTRTFF